jgi:hypothetical protein
MHRTPGLIAFGKVENLDGVSYRFFPSGIGFFRFHPTLLSLPWRIRHCREA